MAKSYISKEIEKRVKDNNLDPYIVPIAYTTNIINSLAKDQPGLSSSQSLKKFIKEYNNYLDKIRPGGVEKINLKSQTENEILRLYLWLFTFYLRDKRDSLQYTAQEVAEISKQENRENFTAVTITNYCKKAAKYGIRFEYRHRGWCLSKFDYDKLFKIVKSTDNQMQTWARDFKEWPTVKFLRQFEDLKNKPKDRPTFEGELFYPKESKYAHVNYIEVFASHIYAQIIDKGSYGVDPTWHLRIRLSKGDGQRFTGSYYYLYDVDGLMHDVESDNIRLEDHDNSGKLSLNIFLEYSDEEDGNKEKMFLTIKPSIINQNKYTPFDSINGDNVKSGEDKALN